MHHETWLLSSNDNLLSTSNFLVDMFYGQQVSEKESGVRQVMSTMGLLNSPFWLTWGLFEGGLPCAAQPSCLVSTPR